MSRQCFICSNDNLDNLFNQKWSVAGCGEIQMGIGICSNCGMTLQDPIVPNAIMLKWYSQIGNYANPSRSGKPSKEKVKCVDNQLDFLKKYVLNKGNAFQVGCSDGYTLSRFKEDGFDVMGIDPSPAAAKISNALYKIKPITGFFENYQPKTRDKYDLIILTHILEHLYDPTISLIKCQDLLNPGGHLLVEVPALIHPEKWSISFFTFEHVNYFSQISMNNLLEKAGFSILGDWSLTLDRRDYPVMTCLAKKNASLKTVEIISDYDKSKYECEYFLKKNNEMWQSINNHLENELKEISHCIIWAAGIHTSQLLANTSLEDMTDIDYLVDIDPQKENIQLGRYLIRSPDSINFSDPTLGIIISSFEAENEIFKGIMSKNNLKVKTIKLHNK